jgi:hypothetical protein
MSCRLHSCLFIVIIVVLESTAKKYHLVYDLVNNEWSLETNFPNAIVQRMPQYMSTILEALNIH